MIHALDNHDSNIAREIFRLDFINSIDPEPSYRSSRRFVWVGMTMQTWCEKSHQSRVATCSNKAALPPWPSGVNWRPEGICISPYGNWPALGRQRLWPPSASYRNFAVNPINVTKPELTGLAYLGLQSFKGED